MIDFSALSSDSWLGRIGRFPLRLLPSGIVVRVIQGPLQGARWIVGSGTHGCWLGSYEAEKQRMFASHVAPGSVVYDAGANVGFYTLLASRLVGPSGRVYAFEPLPRNLEYLRRHVELNGCRNVEVWACAVAEKDGKRRFDPSDGPSTGRLAAAGPAEVGAVSIDSLVLTGNIRPPSVLKIDIEGAEFEMLRGAESTLKRYRPTLFLATHGSERRAECQAFLAGLGYSLVPIEHEALVDADELLAEPGPANVLPEAAVNS